MQITSRFTVAVHTLIAIEFFKGRHKTTSEFLAGSVRVNPVVIRRILQNLKAAGLIEVKAGSGGAQLTKRPDDITLYDVYKAVDSVGDSIFRFHESPNPSCPVGRNIHAVLDGHLDDAQTALENELRKVTLRDLLGELDEKTA